MTTLADHHALLILWLAFTLAATLGVVAVLVWAVRARQFTRQDHARHLALLSGIPEGLTTKNTKVTKKMEDPVSLRDLRVLRGEPLSCHPRSQ